MVTPGLTVRKSQPRPRPLCGPWTSDGSTGKAAAVMRHDAIIRRFMALRAGGFAVTIVLGIATVAPGSAVSETLDGALARAYVNNPTLNAQRASVRATDETVPQALSGYRPRVNA